MHVTVYSKPDCPQCDLTKRDLEILGIPFDLVDISQDEGMLNKIRELGFRSAPVVETDQDAWSGYNQEKIKSLLKLLAE